LKIKAVSNEDIGDEVVYRIRLPIGDISKHAVLSNELLREAYQAGNQ
jgi:hypothetical protein